MGFREYLEEVCKVDGAVAASVIGVDGIAIDTHTPGQTDVDIDVMLVEFTGILSSVRSAASSLETGEVQEFSIGTERLAAFVRPINQEYLLVLAMKPEGNTGKGRYLLRVTAPKLRQEF